MLKQAIDYFYQNYQINCVTSIVFQVIIHDDSEKHLSFRQHTQLLGGPDNGNSNISASLYERFVNLVYGTLARIFTKHVFNEWF